ncbi:MAG TPA: SDR family oxidoreductase [Steroidobacteraceae bacterium]|nr:SDR family oxidoreductase [Steroidobacteraceae bacterium]
MRLKDARVLLTGAAGGIGRAIAAKLLAEGARVLLVDRDARALDEVSAQQGAFAQRLDARVADLTSARDRAALCDLARVWHGGIDVLVNNAGVNPFGLYEELTPEQIDLALAVNLQAPMHLCRELLPHLLARAPAAIVNTGSVFGSIGYPGYAAYAATKFGLRGFTEALRRELADRGVGVYYIAPRATRTGINSSAVEQMNRELGVTMDPPERIAEELAALLRSGRSSVVVGWPEKLFVRVNGLLPALVDRAVRRQLPIIRHYARVMPQDDSSQPAVLERLDIRRHAP